jgi:NADP-dependent 3-hydroxy acid dehydrogenase YdfG
LFAIAGVAGDLAGLDQQDKNVWQRVYDVNVMGAVYTTKHVCLHMQQRKSGAIVNISSVAGIRSPEPAEMLIVPARPRSLILPKRRLAIWADTMFG